MSQEELGKTYKLFSREGDIAIYGKDFVENMESFESSLNAIDEKYNWFFKGFPENRRKSIEHLNIGYTDRYLKIITSDGLVNAEIIKDIKNAYLKQFTGAPIEVI
ncbi:hypothetical protein [Mucilaginibacter sp.]|uniref:hypothetical protein n=1 Tax=Mucilaginibacter sp. TaxID=1882438 RepID=UPI0026340B31|nr:hypothetical protein [Mucilaginibacter sp.]MDB5127601.1 hypothetical protein [Mucilaginibacter sp.]